MRLHADALSAAPPCAMDELEVRRLFAADFSTALVLGQGFFGTNDVVDLTVDITNSGSSDAPVATANVLLALSADTIVGNADDILAGGSANTTAIPAGTTRSYPAFISILPPIPAGDYYVTAIVQGVNETNTSNNETITDTPLVRVVTAAFTNPTIIGTAGNDVITFEQHAVNTVVTVNGDSSMFANGDFDHLFVDGSTGADRIFVTNAEVDIRLQITGGGGNDIIVGGNAGDELSGANGKDKVFGGDGNDYLLGSASADFLTGEAGDDTMSGAGGNDRISDIFGRDHFLGGAGNDTFLCRDLSDDPLSGPDTVSGGLGTDKAQVNEGGVYLDDLASIEELIA
ncbi:MAG: calcium-binding protein [Tepidisphaeraceae bacterium]